MRNIFLFMLLNALACFCLPAAAQTNHANQHMHQRSFEELVKEFERPDRDFWQRPDSIVKYFEPFRGKKVVDIGAGTGYFAFRLQAAGASVVAADIDERFIAYMDSIRKARGISEKSLQTRKVPEDDPMLQKREADAVLMVNTYHHIENRTAYMRKVKAGLKSNGYVVIVDFFKKDLPVGPPVSMKLTADEIIRELKMAGFQHFKVDDTRLPYQYVVLAM